MAEEFMEFARKTLIEKLGDSGEDLLARVMAKNPIDNKSSPDEISGFIKTIEHIATAISDQEKAAEIGLILRNRSGKATSNEKVDNLDAEIEEFLKKHDLPTENDILEYTKYLTLKYGGSASKVEKDLIEKVRTHIKNAINRNKINEEVHNFLVRYPQPTEADVNEFINYIRLLKLGVQENELRERIEKERLFRKFHGAQEAPDMETSEVGQFINLIKTTKDKEAIGKAMRSQGLSYLIKDEEGKGLSEFVELVAPSEEDMKDTLEGLGLEHLIKKKTSK